MTGCASTDEGCTADEAGWVAVAVDAITDVVKWLIELEATCDVETAVVCCWTVEERADADDTEDT